MSQQPNGDNKSLVRLHVRGDSDSAMEALFSVLDKPEPPQSFKNKKLPSSFFIQPDSSGHSREGSQDSGGAFLARQTAGLNICHPRSRSSPAQLPRNVLSAPPAPVHIKQSSVDLLEDAGQSPRGWDVPGKTRQSQAGQQPQPWQQNLLDVHKSSSSHSLNGQQNGATPTLSPSQSLQHSPAVSMQDLGPLPPGWDQGVTGQGEIYFINHLDKTTSWFDPRIPKHLQKPGPIRVSQAQPISQASGLTAVAQPPPQLSPSTPKQQQQQQQQPPPRVMPNENFFQMELQRLQREKERLKREQDDIINREAMLQKLMAQQSISVDTKPSLQAVTSSIDPFLGHSSNSLESHVRQNSADSGLGGMGTGFSLTRTTTDDFLSNVDEMDTQDGGPKLMKQHTSDFNMNDLPSPMGMNLGGLGDPTNPTGPMDSDDLEPSLQEDIERELMSMNEMDDPKMENLLYM